MKKCTILFAGAFLLVVLFGGAAYAQSKAGQGKINLNTATIEELQLLPGIGESMAKDILAFRKSKGSFKSVDELDSVKGIGKKKLNALRGYLKLDGKSDFEPARQKQANGKKHAS